MSLLQKPFAKNSPKIRQRVSSPKTIHQRFANVSVPQKPFGKDSPKIRQIVAKDLPTCQFPKCHSPNIRQILAKDSPTCQFAKNYSPKIRQRVSSPKAIRETFAKDSPNSGQRFANVSVPKCHSPNIRKILAKDSRTCQFATNHSPKIR